METNNQHQPEPHDKLADLIDQVTVWLDDWASTGDRVVMEAIADGLAEASKIAYGINRSDWS
ncbi:MAG: hypothetical protein F4124_12225 [Acidimicrobiia bacterium]|nr:hypothetical protein [Acidimicrobiia bacterium]MYB74416.1 hypothetical protein [Acidimicrobiia bacterium]MYI00184.1 hypothetical protein [Acidimicrobiia bacterium]